MLQFVNVQKKLPRSHNNKLNFCFYFVSRPATLKRRNVQGQRVEGGGEVITAGAGLEWRDHRFKAAANNAMKCASMIAI